MGGPSPPCTPRPGTGGLSQRGLRADGAPGSCGLEVGADVTPTAASAAERIWPSFLVGVDLVTDPKELF